MAIPDGYEINTDDDYKLQRGEKFYSIFNSTLVGNVSSFAGKTVREIREQHKCFVIRPTSLPEEFKDKYEINTDENYELERGEIFLYRNIGGKIWTRDSAQFYANRPIKELRAIGIKSNQEYLFLIEKKNLTPEEQLNIIKRKSRNFVDKHIRNPKKVDYLKFEESFLREDNFGL